MHFTDRPTIRRHGRALRILSAAMACLGIQAAPARAIVGGTSATGRAYQFIVSLRGDGYPYCGGTLITPRWVLTAAHCAAGRSPGRLTAVIGQTLINGHDGEIRGVDRMVVDPAYDPATEDYDVALVRLATPTAGITPARLIRSGDHVRDAPGTVATVIGYGSTAAQSLDGSGPVSYPGGLEQARVPILTARRCASVFDGRAQPAVHADRMICAGGDGRHDACVGDSGGPLLVPDATAGAWTDVAVTSWGAGCAVRGVPGVYVRLSDPAIASFIADNARG